MCVCMYVCLYGVCVSIIEHTVNDDDDDDDKSTRSSMYRKSVSVFRAFVCVCASESICECLLCGECMCV